IAWCHFFSASWPNTSDLSLETTNKAAAGISPSSCPGAQPAQPRMKNNCFDELGVRSHGDAVFDFGGIFQQYVVAMQEETLVLAHRSAVMDNDLSFGVFAFNAKAL